MKRNGLFFASCALVLGFVFMACPASGGDGTAIIQKDDNSPDTGSLTITGIPTKYNGMYLLTKSKDNTEPALFAGESFDEKSKTIFLAKVSGGKASMKIWKEDNDAAAPYKGNDQTVQFDEVFIFRTKSSFAETDWNYSSFEDAMDFLSQLAANGKTTVNFTNGVGTGAFIEGSIEDLMSFH